MEPREEIAAFLYYGFVPEVPATYRSLPWARIRPADRFPPETSEEELIERGRTALRAACADTSGSFHVVPLSGGFDSRVILGALLEAGLRERLVGVTFGLPGTLDFEIGAEVARRAGIAHEAVDLSRVAVDRASLVDTVENGGAWTDVFEAFYNHLLPRRFGAEATHWSGIMANTMNGSRQGVAADSWDDALETFAHRFRIVRSVDLTAPGFRATSVLPDAPLLEDTCLTLFEQIYLLVRYPGRLEPILLRHGHDYRMPFRRPEWVDFMLRVPPALRAGERLYRKIATRSFPDLFALRTKLSHGLPLTAPRWKLNLHRGIGKVRRSIHHALPRLTVALNPKLNYIDFDAGLRDRADFRELVAELVDGLHERNLVGWIDIPRLWRRHMRREANHADALQTLASLEINLQVAERGMRTRGPVTSRRGT